MEQPDQGRGRQRYAFVTVDCLRATVPGGSQWRLSGSRVDGTRLLVDIAGAAASELPLRLSDAVLEPAGPEGWQLSGGGRSFLLPHSRIFVHEDLGAAMQAAIPPRRVPWSRRIFWQIVFLLMRSDTTRAWLLRRYRS